MTLRLVPPPAGPPTPSTSADERASPRRPGERHEAIRVPERAAQPLRRAAARARVTADLAAALLLEARLILDWLEPLGIAPPSLACAGEPVTLSAAEADYLRGLTLGRHPGAEAAGGRAAPGMVALPVRLVARASPAALERAAHGDLELAIGWEVNAVRSGLGMGEWAARAALRAVEPCRGPRR